MIVILLMLILVINIENDDDKKIKNVTTTTTRMNVKEQSIYILSARSISIWQSGEISLMVGTCAESVILLFLVCICGLCTSHPYATTLQFSTLLLLLPYLSSFFFSFLSFSSFQSRHPPNFPTPRFFFPLRLQDLYPDPHFILVALKLHRPVYLSVLVLFPTTSPCLFATPAVLKPHNS